MSKVRGVRLTRFKYYLLLHLIVIAYGFTGILGKLIALDFYRLVFFRMLIAGLSLGAFLLLRKKKFRIRGRRALLKTIAVGLVVVLHWLTFFKAIQVSTASLGVLCLATAALHVSWLEPLLMKRRFSWQEFGLGVLVIMGVIAVSGNMGGNATEGLFWGLISAFLSALFAVLNAKLNKKDKIPAASLTIYEMLTGALFLFVLLFFQGRVNAEFFTMRLVDFSWLLFLGIVCTSVAFLLMIDVINKIGAYTATLTVNLEPVYSIILAVFMLSENEFLGPRFYLGAFFIVLIVFANPVLNYWQRKRKMHRITRTRQSPF